jgi:hypothetical protein
MEDSGSLILPVAREVAALLSPQRIYLYNRKRSVQGRVTAFKLCVVALLADKEEAEREIYRRVDSAVPYDILLYTPEEWAALLEDPSSYAYHINANGTVVYEQTQA